MAVRLLVVLGVIPLLVVLGLCLSLPWEAYECVGPGTWCFFHP